MIIVSLNIWCLCSQWVLTLLRDRVTYWMLKSFKYLTTIESISLITVVCVHSAVFSAFLFVLSYNLFSISCVIMCSFYYLVISSTFSSPSLSFPSFLNPFFCHLFVIFCRIVCFFLLLNFLWRFLFLSVIYNQTTVPPASSLLSLLHKRIVY